jgi:hypothetical protein
MGIKRGRPLLMLKRSEVLALGDGEDASHAGGIKNVLDF